jgi:transcriptional regulator with XRE-family HTH domain
MPRDTRTRAQLEKARALVRALHLTELENAGQARAAALATADSELQRIATRLPDALEAGISLSEIARITGVSRPTLYELRGRTSEEPRDLTLALLQLIATRGAMPVHDVADALGRPAREYEPVLDDLIRRGLTHEDVDEEAEPPVAVYVLTARGEDLLENWEFVSAEEGREP